MERRYLISICLALFLTLPGCDASGPAGHSLIMATASPGGTYYPVGVGIGSLVTEKLQPSITASAINSAGSGENIQMMVNGEAQLGILQGLFGAMAYLGTGQYTTPIKDIRSITMLWLNVEHFLIRSDAVKSGTLTDLQALGSKFSIGLRGSGTEGSTRTILQALSIDPEKNFQPEYLSYSPSVQAMMDGRIAGASVPAGPPVAAATQAYAQMGDGVSLLNITDEQLTAIRAAYPIWTRYEIAAGTYPGQKSSVRTIAQPNFLACRSDLPVDVVYKMTRAIYQNLGYLQNIHSATNGMRIDKAIEGLAVPLHPGAIKYYREQGVTIPSSLVVDTDPQE
jgi:TRAP transporter TAXI family solute receptor